MLSSTIRTLIGGTVPSNKPAGGGCGGFLSFFGFGRGDATRVGGGVDTATCEESSGSGLDNRGVVDELGFDASDPTRDRVCRGPRTIACAFGVLLLVFPERTVGDEVFMRPLNWGLRFLAVAVPGEAGTEGIWPVVKMEIDEGC